MGENYALELRDISKSFGSVQANDHVDLTLRKSEILAILGENGSGKTTLMNMIYGIYYPDEGHIFVNGKEVTIRSPKDSYELGIGMVHQHFKLVDVLTAAENIVLGLPGKGKLDMKRITEDIQKLADKYGFELDLSQKIYEMSVSQKQTVEIIKMLYRGARILILDEPTAVLTPQESDRLFDILRNMRKDGCSIMIITHKLQEVLALSDRVAILRKGKYIDTVETAQANAQSLSEMMVGGRVDLNIDRPEPENVRKRLVVKGLNCKNKEEVKTLDDVDLTVNAGEILGIAGISGSGQKEFLEAIAGLQAIESGSITLLDDNGKGTELAGMDSISINKAGISLAFVPEDRIGMGLVGDMDMTDNMMLRSYRNGKSPFLDRKGPKALALKIKEQLEVMTPSISAPVRQMSGGNVQKVLVGREIAQNPKVLLVAFPTRGVDVNTSHVIYRLLNEQKKKGVAVVCVIEDLDVVLELCDRIAVFCGGKISGIEDGRTATKEGIGILMTKHEKRRDTGMKKEPFLQVSKRRNKARWQERLLIRFIALILALIVCGAVIVALVKMNPVDVYKAIWDGAMGSDRRLWQTIRDTMVLLCISIGLAPAFKMKFWNIGAEGQILIGGACSAAAMIYAGDKMPAGLLLIVMFVASALGGMIWGMIPAVFKANWNTNETLFTLMLNYVAMQVVTYCIVFWENPKGSNTVGIINQATKGGWLPELFGQKYGWNVVIVLILTVGMFIYLKYCKQGYEIAVVGESENTARYAGIQVKKVIIRTMAISGAICGIAGFVIVSGASHTISTATAGGRGFTAIIVAWLSKFNTFIMVAVSFGIVFMNQGAVQIATQYGLNENASNVLLGIILFFLIGAEFFINYRVKRAKK